ncbi:hypothetical protein NDA16_003680 [Ustilago loliicola]|nr:hypothetical protein NDA16_003680 [Ustilago loliicola]
MSPHDRSLVSLVNSIFEPNFLILISYLLINLYLAFRVIRVATKRYRQLKMTPSESGEIGAVEQLSDAESDVMEAHETLFRRKKRRKNDKTDTPVADALIRLATWAFKANAVRAKCIVALLAIISLGSTWYYMLAFLRHSYLAYLERCHLTSYPLPPTPPPFSLGRLDLFVPALHLRILRISQWLASLSLFKEAWMEVIKDATSWWWSSEICIITVGAWALFLRHEAERIRMPHVWTVMALGQLVSISFAFNLFNLGVIYRLDTKDLLARRSDQVTKPKHRVIEPYKVYDSEFEDSSSSDPGSSSEGERHAGHRSGYEVAIRTCDVQRVGSRSPPPPRPASSLPPTPSRSPDPNVPNVVTFSTSYIVKKTPLPPRPTFMDKVGMVMQKVVPERIGLPLFVIAGLSSVLQHPDSFGKVMVMHLFPLLISLYPSKYHFELMYESRNLPRSRFGSPLELAVPVREDPPDLTTRQILLKMMGRTDTYMPLWQDVKMMYLSLGVTSVVLRLWLTLTCFKQTDSSGTILQRAWQTMTLLATVFVLIESGVWIWKAAVAAPSAFLPGQDQDDDDDDDDDLDEKRSKASRSTIRLVDEDRKLIETQARVVVALDDIKMAARVFQLVPGVQSYDWGIRGATSSRVAQFAAATKELGFKAEDGKPYAELWMGTHTSLPSRVIVQKNGKEGEGGEFEALSAYLAKHPELIGNKVVEKFSDEKVGCLPFLFKVLSVGKALSIQAHPDKKLGKKLHEQRPDVYKDPNHKPEMAIALTPFRGFCGFRPLPEIIGFIKKVPEFAQLAQLSPSELSHASDLKEENETKQVLKTIFTNLMNSPPTTYEPLAAQLSDRYAAGNADQGVGELEQKLVLKLAEEFPRDVGIFCTFLLNISSLQPGEALFLQANEPHAYLEGEILECMASSDNVVRAGLTPKLRDTETLISMCTYQSGSDRGRLEPVQWSKAKVVEGKGQALLYDPPIEEFSVVTIEVDGKLKNDRVDGPSILLVLEGEVLVGEVGGDGLRLSKGQLAFVGAGVEVMIEGEGAKLARAFVEV